jgi:ribosomal protein S18 acetylase RimI-like enzyme
MTGLVIVDALATGRLQAARDITVEYLALTQGEAGFVVPQAISELPEPLRRIVDTLEDRHRTPGVLLLALCGDAEPNDDESEVVCGTVALAPSALTQAGDGVVQRLYVRESFRRKAIASRLMEGAHAASQAAGFRRAVLNVMTSRVGAQAFYRGMGYRPLDEDVDWPYGGVWLCRDLQS